MPKTKSPLLSKSADSYAVCGVILQRGKPVIVDESSVSEKERSLAEKGLFKILPHSPGKLQIMRN